MRFEILVLLTLIALPSHHPGQSYGLQIVLARSNVCVLSVSFWDPFNSYMELLEGFRLSQMVDLEVKIHSNDPTLFFPLANIPLEHLDGYEFHRIRNSSKTDR